MKYFTSIALIVVLLLTSTPITTYAHSTSTTPTVTYYEIKYISDDYYVETIIEEYSITTYSSTSTVKGAKTDNIRNSNNDIIATFKITGTFTYDGSTAQCTAASHSSTINDSAWAFTFKSANRLTNRAIGQYAMQCTQYGTVVQTISDTVTLTCSPNGTLS